MSAFDVTIKATVIKTIRVLDVATEQEATELAHQNFTVEPEANGQEKYTEECIGVVQIAENAFDRIAAMHGPEWRLSEYTDVDSLEEMFQEYDEAEYSYIVALFEERGEEITAVNLDGVEVVRDADGRFTGYGDNDDEELGSLSLGELLVVTIYAACGGCETVIHFADGSFVDLNAEH